MDRRVFNAVSASENSHDIAEIYRSTKTYDHSEGFSCCFRQWRATHSHCRLLHGYALAFRFVFAASTLDENHWCLDFGSLQPLKAWLKEMFDHTFLVAEDDPDIERFQLLAEENLAQVRILPAVGCEATAKFTFDYVSEFVRDRTRGRVWLESVEVREHGGNSAIYSRGVSGQHAHHGSSQALESPFAPQGNPPYEFTT